jgi:hypothetical protein
MTRFVRTCGTVITCADCNATLTIRPDGFGTMLGMTGWEGDWFMVKDRVWQLGQHEGKCRFLCVGCLENRIGRRLTAGDFRRSARVNFVGENPPSCAAACKD